MAISLVINNFIKLTIIRNLLLITRISKSLFNFIATIISGGGFFKSAVWFALKVALLKKYLYFVF